MNLPLLFALAPLLAQAADRPAWEIAPRWDCQADNLRICKGLGGDCTFAPNAARFHIDFETARFTPGIGGGSEHIVGRNFYEGRYGPGFTKLVFDSGDSAALASRPSADGKSWEMVVTRAQPAQQYSFLGTCSPAA
ncbi:hypothetical protein OF829_04220 [Sphingomonas sp. LB-2]|uniref:hypothetical protein n=1 Tax=Sphingomonas caeni TaxID=2984949 RepID=UPI00222E0F20|nr:hypothetical protein [Sphingomonas caeni]MCW3846433.1 hypothetical protein [Sphingomonas caeni]